MSRRPTENKAAGFTLVEVSILLTVAVILSAVIVPVMSRSIADTRMSVARAEMTAIAAALRTFLQDIGCEIVPQHGSYGKESKRLDVVEAPLLAPPVPPPATGDGAARALLEKHGARPCSRSRVCGAAPVEMLVSSGDVPAVGPQGDWDWAEPVNGRAVDYLEYYLISNTPGAESSRAFPTLEECGSSWGSHGGGWSGRFGGAGAWRGAYLNVGHGDPWGNRYMVNTVFLAHRSAEDVVVLSAGPDQEIDSAFGTDGFVPGDDDIAVLVSPGY